VTAPGPSSLPLLLRDNPDTVTHLLEALTGEPLVADVVRQYSMPAEAGNTLGVGAGQTITQRIAVLKGGVTMVPYVYAESAFVPARLPESARLQLERTSDPIGRVLAAHGLDHAREETPSPGLPGTPRALDAAVRGASAVVWSRTYRLTIDDLPVFAICEWFFRSVQDAVERPTPA
jgi:chorismate-pyruvate lyase